MTIHPLTDLINGSGHTKLKLCSTSFGLKGTYFICDEMSTVLDVTCHLSTKIFDNLKFNTVLNHFQNIFMQSLRIFREHYIARDAHCKVYFKFLHYK